MPRRTPSPIRFSLPEMRLTPRDAFFSQGEVVEKQAAVGRIAQQIVATCPPGIPVVIPGERITAAHLPFLPESVRVVGV